MAAGDTAKGCADVVAKVFVAMLMASIASVAFCVAGLEFGWFG